MGKRNKQIRVRQVLHEESRGNEAKKNTSKENTNKENVGQSGTGKTGNAGAGKSAPEPTRQWYQTANALRGLPERPAPAVQVPLFRLEWRD